MKKLILLTALIISAKGRVFAQEKKQAPPSKTQSNFNMDPDLIQDRHWVSLPKDEKIIIEMRNTGYYRLISNVDSLLLVFSRDIAFYKDSLDAAGSARIDYVFTSNPGVRKIRFKKYPPDGDLFIDRQNEVSKLKIEQDTIRVAFQAPWGEKPYKADDGARRYSDIPLQVTFCLNNYTNIEKIIRENGMLNHIVDTLAIASKPRRKSYDCSSIGYRPFDTVAKHSEFSRFKKAHYLVAEEKDLWKTMGMLVINGSIGAGLIKNTIAPTAEIGIEINDRWRGAPQGGSSFLRLSTAPYFFFDKDPQNRTLVKDNWFVNLEFGMDVRKKRTSMGVGYLYSEKGGYFQNATFKLFVSEEVFKHFTLSPEIIFNNNFKQIFPGITLKGF